MAPFFVWYDLPVRSLLHRHSLDLHQGILGEAGHLVAEGNLRVLSPLWLRLLEEGQRDGSIPTQYAKELSQLLPLIDFWLTPSVFPGTPEELQGQRPR